MQTRGGGGGGGHGSTKQPPHQDNPLPPSQQTSSRWAASSRSMAALRAAASFCSADIHPPTRQGTRGGGGEWTKGIEDFFGTPRMCSQAGQPQPLRLSRARPGAAATAGHSHMLLAPQTHGLARRGPPLRPTPKPQPDPSSPAKIPVSQARAVGVRLARVRRRASARGSQRRVAAR